MSEQTEQDKEALRNMIESLNDLKRATLEAFTAFNRMHETLVQAQTYPHEVVADIVAPLPEQLFAILDKLPGRNKYEASPLGADGKIYCISHKGETDVIDAATGKVLHSTDLSVKGTNDNRRSIIAAGGSLIIKVHNKLYCFGAAKVN